ncbi:cation-transporting P-type ATPase [Mycolicibacterium fortuitum]
MNNAVAPATLTPAKAADRLSVRAAAEARNDVEVTLTNVRGHHDGLTVEDAAQRLAVDGPNEVAHPRPVRRAAEGRCRSPS